MKKYTIGLIMLAAILLSSCTDNSKELSSNIGKWNGTVSEMNRVYNFVDKVESPSEFSQLKTSINSTQKNLKEEIEILNTGLYNGRKIDVSKDAKAMNSALADYMTTCLDILAVFQQLSDNADNLTDEDVDRHYNSFDSLSLILEQKENIVDKAQTEYAKKFGIQLSTINRN